MPTNLNAEYPHSHHPHHTHTHTHTHMHTHTRTHTHTHFSLSIPGGDPELRETYSDLLPEPPRIIDPVNPSNNVYLSGISKSKDNGWDIFAQNIDSVDLSGGKPEIHILPQSFSF